MTRPWPADTIERWPIDELIPSARNARIHSDAQVTQIAASMQQFGWTNPVLVDEERTIIAGHGRVLAARQLTDAGVEGWTDIPVMIARGWSDAERRAYLIADNKLPMNAEWDMQTLSAELLELDAGDFDISLTGFAELELADMFAAQPEPADDAADALANEVPEPASAVTTRAGDIWILGQHRMMCGDCRQSGDVIALLGNQQIHVVVTSPPYAEQRDYDESSGFRPVKPDEYVQWWEPVSANVARHLAPDGSMFINIKPAADGLDTSLYVFDLVIAHVRLWGWHFATEFCWERPGVPKSVKRRFKNQFEPVYQFSRGDWKIRAESVRHPSDNVPIAGGKGIGDTSWKGAHGSNWSIAGETAKRARKRAGGTSGSMASVQCSNTAPGEYIGPGLAYPGNLLPTFTGSHEALGHAAAFPVGLPEFFIRAYSDEGDAIFDPFGGSGSTLIAAERTSRRGFSMDISPLYVDIAVRRWQTFTGKQATLENGASFDDVRAQRLPA